MIPNTFIYVENRNGRPHLATGYVCQHRQNMIECTVGDDIHRIVGQRMVDWWNNSFTQMQDRIVVRDSMMRGVYGTIGE